MNKRYLGALILAPFVIFLFLGGEFLHYGLMVLSLMGMYEIYKASTKCNINPLKYFGYALCIIYYLTLNCIGYKELFLLIVGVVFLMFCIPILNVKYNFIDVAVTLLGFFYVAVLFSFITLIDSKNNGNYLIWLIFISSWLCDTAAYYTGRYFGKHKLCPKVSPKKTVEGSIGGLLGGTIACALYGLVISKNVSNISLYNYIFIGLLCGILCQFGDLWASSIKRHAEIKDYSNLIPGHGGILDRFDSILFASLVVYYYITFILGM